MCFQLNSRKCFENFTPIKMPNIKDSDEAWLEFKEVYAKDACNLWGKINDCYKPPIELIEKCLDKDGFIVEVLETVHKILCIDQDEKELSKSI